MIIIQFLAEKFTEVVIIFEMASVSYNLFSKSMVYAVR